MLPVHEDGNKYYYPKHDDDDDGDDVVDDDDGDVDNEDDGDVDDEDDVDNVGVEADILGKEAEGDAAAPLITFLHTVTE